MEELSLITDELRSHIGVPGAERGLRITPELVRRVRETLAGGPVAGDDGVPPGLLMALESDSAVPAVGPLPPNSLVTGDEWEWRRALRVGETLTGASRLVDAYERFGGRLGHALFLRYEWQFTDEDGAPAAFARRSMAYYAAAGVREPEEPTDAPPEDTLPEMSEVEGVDAAAAAEGDPLPAWTVTPALAQIVRYCGLAWAFPPFFYDEAAARAAGLPYAIVPGPLKLALLAEYVQGWAGSEALLTLVRAAHRRPDAHDRPLRLHGGVTGVEATDEGRRLSCDLWIENPWGQRSVAGAATVVLPG